MRTDNIEMAVLPECKLVPEAPIARKLLKDGYRVVDINPKRGHTRETVFMFEVVPGFMEKLNEYNSERKENGVKEELPE